MKHIRDILRILTLTCEQSALIASDSYERPLNWHERAALRTHLINCRWCRRVRKQLETLHVLNKRMREQRHAKACCPGHTLSSKAKDRIAERLS